MVEYWSAPPPFPKHFPLGFCALVQLKHQSSPKGNCGSCLLWVRTLGRWVGQEEIETCGSMTSRLLIFIVAFLYQCMCIGNLSQLGTLFICSSYTYWVLARNSVEYETNVVPTLVGDIPSKSTDPGTEREERVVWNMEGLGPPLV